MNSTTQVLVVGGGPAGSTTATMLAREGFDVTLIEKEVFPRYHIGESLLPSCLEILDLIGAREKIEAYGFQRKDGGYFAWGNESWELDFTKLRHPYSFQVVRSEFDQLLLEHARSQGVKVYEGREIRGLTFEGERPRSAIWSQGPDDTNTGEISFDTLVDASGRAGIMGMRYLKNRHYHDAFQNVAIWGYWQGADRMSFAPDGAIAVGSVPDGWFWGIPLHNDTMSVGLVLHKTTFKEKRQQGKSLEQIYYGAMDECPLILDLLKSATCVSEQMKVEQDYSYMSDKISGPGYFMVGDAACFIDPLLSTGVHLATHGSMLAAASIASMFRGEVTEEQALHFYEHSYRHAYLRLMVIVSGLYMQYRGKANYFWQAQQLTHNDFKEPDKVYEAFLYVVSGVEDQKDIVNSPQDLSMPDLAGKLPEGQEEREKAWYQVYHKVFLRSSMTAETAIEGMYVATKPRLGLSVAQDDPVMMA